MSWPTIGLFFHETLSPREGRFGERRHPAGLLEAARATKQRKGRSNDVSDNSSEDTCPGVAERATRILTTDESESGSGECMYVAGSATGMSGCTWAKQLLAGVKNLLAEPGLT